MDISKLLCGSSTQLDTNIEYNDTYLGYIITIVFNKLSKNNEFLQQHIQYYSEYPVRHDEEFLSKISIKYEDLLNDGWEFNVIELGPIYFYKIPELEYMQYERGIGYLN